MAATNFTVNADVAISFNDKPKEDVKVTLTLPSMWVSVIRLEVVPQGVKETNSTAPKKRIGATLALSASLRSAGKDIKLPFHFGEADHKEERYSMGLPVIGVTDRWQISTNDEHQTAVWLLDKPVQAKAGDAVLVSLGNAAAKKLKAD